MKGPGMRLDLDVRRLWRCPACSTQRLTPGRVTFVRCHFCKDHPAMVLVERPRPFRPPRPPLDLIIDLHPDDVDAPPFVPLHLREPEPQPEAPEATPPVELHTESIPSPSPDEATVAEAGAAVSQQVLDGTSSAEIVEAADAGEAPPPPNKKKRRSRRQRRRGRSGGTGGAPQSGADDAPPARPPAEAPGAGTAT